MSTQKTSWILDFIDKVSKPIASMMQNVGKGTLSINGMTKAVKLNEKDTKIDIYLLFFFHDIMLHSSQCVKQ